MFTSQYFDASDFEKPIKREIVARSIWLQPSQVPFYIYRVSENFAVLKDSWITNLNNAKNQTYYSVSLTENKMSQSSLTSMQYLLLNFDSDPNVLTTER